MPLVLSCEHATNRIPKALAALFIGHEALVQSHRGVDFGARSLSRLFAAVAKAPLHEARVSRLVVDLNRSLTHPRCLSEVTAALSPGARTALINRYYHPYRRALAADVARATAQGACVTHIGVHSFTPIWQGTQRRVDIGLLFDPARPLEVTLCRAWQAALQQRRPKWRIRRNNPYLGTADGITTRLRHRLEPSHYVGIELEINQAFAQAPKAMQRAYHTDIVESFVAVWRNFQRAQGQSGALCEKREGRARCGVRRFDDAAAHKKF